MHHWKDELSMPKASSIVRRCGAALAVMLGAAASQLPAHAATDVTIDNKKAVADAIAKALDIGAPFQAAVSCPQVFLTSVCEGSFSVPATSRLVIEYISFNCVTSGGPSTPKLGTFFMTSTVGGVRASNWVTLPEYEGANLVQFGQTVKIYADQASTVGFAAGVPTGSFADTCAITLSGRQIAD